MVRPMPSDRCLSVSVCPVICDIGVLWPNGWMDLDETWHTGRPWPWPHCVRWGPSSPPPKGGRAHQFSANISCGQTAGWINMPRGREVGLSPSDVALDGDRAPLPQKKAEPPTFGPCLLWPRRLDRSRCRLAWRQVSAQATLCSMGTHLSLPQRGTAPIFSPYLLWSNGWMDQDTTW